MSDRRRANLGREIWWLLVLIGFGVFVSTDHVSTYLGARGRGRATVWVIWRDLASDLPGGGSDVVKIGYLLIIAVTIIGSFVGLWLTLSNDQSPEIPNTAPSVQIPPETL